MSDAEAFLALEERYMDETRLFPPGRSVPVEMAMDQEDRHRAAAFKFWRECESLRALLAMLEHPAMGDDDNAYCAICTHYKPWHDPQCELAALLGGPR